ncbi:VanZ family protein [Pseudoflavonifractor sp. CLA-AP-H29]|uniref:VanZ family protein n=1 Tax=Pseudoflavonifractor intestinihominis TaxID=3133171 RepID=A0ABV1E849_9FIRM
MNTLLWYWEITWDYIYEMLPCMALAAVGFFLLRPTRRRRLERLNLASGVWREGALLVFVLFCAGLAALTVFPSGVWGALMHGYPPAESWFGWHGYGMYLQVTILTELLEGSEWVRYMLLGNAVMFLPLGFFPALLWRQPRWWRSVLAAGGASLFIEIIQIFVGRSSDINDLILNTLGGLAGYGLYRLLARLVPKFTRKFQVEVPDGRDSGDSTAPGGAE